jgi:hypothetical protein
MTSSDSKIKEKNLMLLRLWLATNGVTWLTPTLTMIIWGIIDKKTLFGGEGFGLALLIALVFLGLFVCAIVTILYLILRHYRLYAGMRMVYLAGAIIGIAFNLLYILDAKEFWGINYLILAIFLVIGFRAWSRLKRNYA